MGEFQTMFTNTLTPVARAWIRYSPVSFGKKWLWDRFCWRRRQFSCKTKFGMRVTGDTEDLIQRYLYFFGVWEPNITRWISSRLRAGDGFVDIGANIGYDSLLAAKLVGPEGQVISIEAAQWIHAILCRHIGLNHLQNIRTVNVAAAATRGIVHVFPGGAGNIGSTTTIPHGRPTDQLAEVEALPIHEILTAEEIKTIRIIKIDVEGAELQVIHGLAPLLARMRPDVEILVEISPNLDGSASEIFSILKAAGFSAYMIQNSYDAESYLFASEIVDPIPLTTACIDQQVDVLFSRAQY